MRWQPNVDSNNNEVQPCDAPRDTAAHGLASLTIKTSLELKRNPPAVPIPERRVVARYRVAFLGAFLHELQGAFQLAGIVSVKRRTDFRRPLRLSPPRRMRVEHSLGL